MPLSSPFDRHRPLERALRLRRNPVAAYSLAVAAIAIAAAVRWAAGDSLMSGLPFITLYPAIVVVALFGGLGPGIVATLLATMVAWFEFLPPAGSFAIERTARRTCSL